jgi:hypothetical protein
MSGDSSASDARNPPSGDDDLAGKPPGHVFRLRGPWEYRPVAFTKLLADGSIVEILGTLPPPGRQILPADWSTSLGHDFRGRAIFFRRFGKPTGMTRRDRLLLVVSRVDAFGVVAVNNQTLGEIPPGGKLWARDVTPLLQLRNLLAIEVHLPSGDEAGTRLQRTDRAGLAGGLLGEVRLELHALHASVSGSHS